MSVYGLEPDLLGRSLARADLAKSGHGDLPIESVGTRNSGSVWQAGLAKAVAQVFYLGGIGVGLISGP